MKNKLIEVYFLQLWKKSVEQNAALSKVCVVIRVSVGDLKKAAENVASFLLYKPTDAVMLENKVFYLSQAEVTEADFQPDKVSFPNSFIFRGSHL